MMRESELNFLDEVIERSKERRSGFCGPKKTNRAETAEIVLAAYAPALLEEVRRLREIVNQQETKP